MVDLKLWYRSSPLVARAAMWEGENVYVDYDGDDDEDDGVDDEARTPPRPGRSGASNQSLNLLVEN